MFIMLDGIDGSGKSTVIKIWKEQLHARGQRLIDLPEYWRRHGRHPRYQELAAADFIFSAEPTRVGVGKVIREELIANGNDYPPLAVAEAYALDRLILYQKIIIPAIADGIGVIQDRGVSTSLCYQALANRALGTAALGKLPGNALALRYRPDHLVLLTVPPTVAAKRLTARAHKQDRAIFENLAFQTKAAERFAAPAFQKIFTDRGTAIHHLPAEMKLDILQKQARELLSRLLPLKTL